MRVIGGKEKLSALYFRLPRILVQFPQMRPCEGFREMPRLVKPDGAKIRRLCDEKGRGAAELAHASRIALATAAKIMRGEPCFRKSLMLVAEVLNNEYVNLLEGSQPGETKKEKRYEIHFHFPIDKELFDDDRVIAIIDMLNKIIGGSGDIDMTDLRDGSTILTLSMNEEDLLRLIDAIDEKRDEIGRQLGISAIHIDWNTLIDFSKSVTEKSNQYSSGYLAQFEEIHFSQPPRSEESQLSQNGIFLSRRWLIIAALICTVIIIIAFLLYWIK
jgi:hypothetical protein